MSIIIFIFSDVFEEMLEYSLIHSNESTYGDPQADIA